MNGASKAGEVSLGRQGMVERKTTPPNGNPMPRIAILGSCITRDLWPIRGGGAEHLLYISRTSLPSLLADPVEGFVPAEAPPGDLHGHEHGALVADLQKTALARLMAFAPTHLIFDFIDERFDLLAVGGALATRSGEYARSGYGAQAALARARVIPRLSPACERLWRGGLEDFATLVRTSPLGRARLILHRSRWATYQRLASGRRRALTGVEILGGDPVRIPDYNALLERQDAALLAAMPPMEIVEAPRWQVADPAHRWGLSPFHYVPEYYDAIRSQLMELGLADAFKASGPAAPGALAA